MVMEVISSILSLCLHLGFITDLVLSFLWGQMEVPYCMYFFKKMYFAKLYLFLTYFFHLPTLFDSRYGSTPTAYLRHPVLSVIQFHILPSPRAA